MDYTPNPAEGQRVYDLDRAHVFHSWSAQAQIKPLPIAAAEGCYFWDYDGNRYLDFSSQLVNVNIGHQHPKVVKAIQDQAARLATIAPQHANDMRGEAAKRIVDRAGTRHQKVFFTNGGADAVENAIRMARLHTHKHKVLSAYRSYHGNTGAAIQATGDPRRWPNEYAAQQVHFFGPFPYRSPFWSDSPEQETERALQHLEEVIKFEGPGTIGAILLESVVGTAGVLVPPPGYLEGLRALCDKYEIVWIADEVMSGFGRTGEWFAWQNWGAEPDLIAFAKGSNSGYVPVGGVVISDTIAATFDERVFPGGLTYSGHPLAAASIVGAIDAMTEEGIVDNAKRIGNDVLGPGLRDLAERHPVIGEARGLGVFWALDLVSDRATKEPLAPYGGTSPAMTEFTVECKKRGLMPFVNFNRTHVVPPCTVTDAEAKEGLAILDEVLTITDQHYTG
ncbi:MAG: aspartate aminotransferase family protein [Actinobacteria bacterium]|nr:aspartate aminotransferase family protein [Actinomycetota bacterium]